jgi:hypothetical protein
MIFDPLQGRDVGSASLKPIVKPDQTDQIKLYQGGSGGQKKRTTQLVLHPLGLVYHPSLHQGGGPFVPIYATFFLLSFFSLPILFCAYQMNNNFLPRYSPEYDSRRPSTTEILLKQSLVL